MRPYRGRLACHDASSLVQRSMWGGPWVWLLLGIVVSLGWLAFVGGPETTVEAQSYSAYSDPEKPVLSFVLSDEQNVEEFQSEFGLSDEEVETALAAIREENEALAEEYAESEQLVESNEGLPDDQIRARVADSDFDERVREIVADTKSTVEDLLPEDRRTELEPWVNARFAAAGQRASEDIVTVSRGGTNKGRGVSCGLRHPVRRLHQVRGRAAAQSAEGARQFQGSHHPKEAENKCSGQGGRPLEPAGQLLAVEEVPGHVAQPQPLQARGRGCLLQELQPRQGPVRQEGPQPRRGGPDSAGRQEAGAKEVPELLGEGALPLGATVGAAGPGVALP